MDKVVPLLVGLCSPGIYAYRTMRHLSLWPTAPAAESRKEAIIAPGFIKEYGRGRRAISYT